jgi:hypothetical protein
VLNCLRFMLAISKPYRSIDFKVIFSVNVLSVVFYLV